MTQSTENVTPLSGQKSDNSPAPEAVVERFKRIFGNEVYGGIEAYVLRGTDPEAAYETIMEDAAPLAALIAGIDTKSDEIADNAVPQAAWMVERLLRMGQEISRCESDRKDAELAAHREQEEREREKRDNSPAGRIDVIRFMTGIGERSLRIVEDDLIAAPGRSRPPTRPAPQETVTGADGGRPSGGEAFLSPLQSW